jgi:uncharacterized protein YprB with RNaseH-like and TPR domain
VSKLRDRLGRMAASFADRPALAGEPGAAGPYASQPQTEPPDDARGARIAALRTQLARVGSKLQGEARAGGAGSAAGLQAERRAASRPQVGARAGIGAGSRIGGWLRGSPRAESALRGEAQGESLLRGEARVERDDAVAPIHVAEDWGPPPTRTLPGESSETPLGPLRRVCTLLETDHQHGAVPIARALEASPEDLALLALDPSLASVDFGRALYIDTETTGLAGGAGTLPFLIGMAWFEGGRLRVEQSLLERPGLEAPMLARLAERLRESSAVVSFNGKSFDWPLLRTRFILQRLAVPALPAHLDLLHCARRVYKRRLGSVRLIHLEEQVLGFTRIDDMPGELIPQTYLGFLRGHVPGAALAPILEHNRLDLVALAALLGELARRFCGERPLQDARDQLGFAGVAARGHAHARALDLARGAAAADLRGELAPEAQLLVGELHLRCGDPIAAERALLLAVEAACGDATRAGGAHLALAKLYEHRFKRFDAALAHAERAITHEGTQAAGRRVARLREKRGRAIVE